jgi:hypothetical protein
MECYADHPFAIKAGLDPAVAAHMKEIGVRLHFSTSRIGRQRSKPTSQEVGYLNSPFEMAEIGLRLERVAPNLSLDPTHHVDDRTYAPVSIRFFLTFALQKDQPRRVPGSRCALDGVARRRIR